jgi:polyhydroxyalkanoate synthesis regulator phasin
MDTASQALAAKITERLVQEGLINTDAAKRIQSELAEGKLRAEDWRLPIELAEKEEPKP